MARLQKLAPPYRVIDLGRLHVFPEPDHVLEVADPAQVASLRRYNDIVDVEERARQMAALREEREARERAASEVVPGISAVVRFGAVPEPDPTEPEPVSEPVDVDVAPEPAPAPRRGRRSPPADVNHG